MSCVALRFNQHSASNYSPSFTYLQNKIGCVFACSFQFWRNDTKKKQKRRLAYNKSSRALPISKQNTIQSLKWTVVCFERGKKPLLPLAARNKTNKTFPNLLFCPLNRGNIIVDLRLPKTLCLPWLLATGIDFGQPGQPITHRAVNYSRSAKLSFAEWKKNAHSPTTTICPEKISFQETRIHTHTAQFEGTLGLKQNSTTHAKRQYITFNDCCWWTGGDGGAARNLVVVCPPTGGTIRWSPRRVLADR